MLLLSFFAFNGHKSSKCRQFKCAKTHNNSIFFPQKSILVNESSDYNYLLDQHLQFSVRSPTFKHLDQSFCNNDVKYL